MRRLSKLPECGIEARNGIGQRAIAFLQRRKPPLRGMTRTGLQKDRDAPVGLSRSSVYMGKRHRDRIAVFIPVAVRRHRTPPLEQHRAARSGHRPLAQRRKRGKQLGVLRMMPQRLRKRGFILVGRTGLEHRRIVEPSRHIFGTFGRQASKFGKRAAHLSLLEQHRGKIVPPTMPLIRRVHGQRP
ncbi:hypothetical protein X963_5094 [Burkholderia pseudomallei MSHR7498]|nr:hypothetical protein DO65_5821 [Burkholderia pseudomallei]KGS17495.1 hypothetical protein X989_5244 [Burkholderia pseudomallei MSHR4378]KGS38203.1 hypothetical protein X992_5520 [Burkholderia pseudomallei MSHR5492]KGS92692.1 hypothetical protein X963_5094 [Burkholderia pseudomallei MSHR7498]KGX51895.1 hypothetical protein Y025_5045 [Burkholderia pseudomallei TSV32]